MGKFIVGNKIVELERRIDVLTEAVRVLLAVESHRRRDTKARYDSLEESIGNIEDLLARLTKQGESHG